MDEDKINYTLNNKATTPFTIQQELLKAKNNEYVASEVQKNKEKLIKNNKSGTFRTDIDITRQFLGHKAIQWSKEHLQAKKELAHLRSTQFYDETLLDQQTIKEIIDFRIKIHTLLLAKDYTRVTETLADKIKSIRIFKTVMDDTKQEVFFYQEGIYVNHGITEIKRLIRLFITDLYTDSLSNKVIDKIVVDSFINHKDFYSTSEKYPHYILVNNGILNIETNTLLPFDYDMVFFNKLPVDFNPSVQNDSVARFVRSIVATEEAYLTLQETIGYGFLRDYRYEKAFMWFGEGRNGKGKLITLINLLFGSHNIYIENLINLEKPDNYSLIKLKDSYFNFCSDIDKHTLNNTGVFRSLTGRDVVSANRKYLNPVSFVNHAKMIFASNGLPQPQDVTQAFWLRWVLVEFPFTFLPQKEIDDLKKTGHSLDFVRLQDPNIVNSLSSKESLEGFLLWSLQGLQRLLLNNDFTFSKSVRILKHDWLRKSNSFISFANDCLVQDYDATMTKSSVKREYLRYCQEHKVPVVGNKAIFNYLSDEFGAIDEREYIQVEGGGSKLIRVWKGFRLRYVSEEKQEVLF